MIPSLPVIFRVVPPPASFEQVFEEVPGHGSSRIRPGRIDATPGTPGATSPYNGTGSKPMTEPEREDVDRMTGPVLLEFGSWCPHCQAIQPFLDAMFARAPDVQHIPVEDGRGKPLGRSFRVKLWPTLVFMRDGEVVSRLVRPSSEEIAKGFAELGRRRTFEDSTVKPDRPGLATRLRCSTRIQPRSRPTWTPLLRDPCRLPGMARREPRHGRLPVGGLLQEGIGPTEHHLARIGRRGPVLRLDRRRPQGHRRRELHDPLHAAKAGQRVEQRERQPGPGPCRTRTHAADRPGAFQARKEDRSGIYSHEQGDVELPEPYRGLLRENRAAWEFFEKQPASYRKAASWWIVSAKKDETRRKRLDKLVVHSAQGERVPQFTWKKSSG